MSRDYQPDTDRDDIQQTGLSLQVAQHLPADLMLLKIEGETMMSAARIQPRRPMVLVAQLKELIDAYPAAAEEAIYSRPVGRVFEVVCDDCGIQYTVARVDASTQCPVCESRKHAQTKPVQKLAEGLSIRAAESIRSVMGYTRMAENTERLPDGSMKISAILTDYAAGNITSKDRVVSPFKKRGGKVERIEEDRFLDVVVKAEQAKLRRDVILDSTPAIVKALFRDECEKKMAELVPDEVIEQRILPAFASYGITLPHLEKLIGREKSLGWREEDRLQLRKLLNALKNEETTAKDLIADLTEKKPTSVQEGTVTGAHLGAAKGQTVEHPHAKPNGAGETVPQTENKVPDIQAHAERLIQQAKSMDEVREVYMTYKDKVPNRESLYESTERREADLQAEPSDTPQPDDQRMQALKQKIFGYKSDKRLLQLLEELKTDGSYTMDQLALAQQWIESRVGSV